jgi:hypothetical protein
MKPLLKILLSLFILIAGIYAATPLWLPYVFARQLPPGWQLERLEAGYPGLSGISINVLEVKGELQAVGLALTATDVRYTYQGLKTDIGSLSLDVFMQASENSVSNALTIDDLSLPITKLTGKLPEFSISQLRVVLHPAANIKSGVSLVTQPLVLNFQALKLLPETNNNFHITTVASIENIPDVKGQLDVDVRENSRKAEIRFPASVGTPAWLAVSLEQIDQSLETTTRLQATFDADQANQDWLDTILMRGTGGLLTHVSGKLEVQADFAGKEMQDIESLSFSTSQLQAEFENGTLTLNAELLARREDEKVTVTLPKPADIQYQDNAGKIDSLLLGAIPELQRTSQPHAMARVILETSSSILIQAGPDPSMEFIGDINLDLTSTESSIRLQTTDLQIEIEDFSNPNSTTAQGSFTLNWVESVPIAYTSDDLGLRAEKLMIANTGQFRIYDLTTEFKQAGDFEFLHPIIKLPGDKNSPPMKVTADELTIKAELTSRNGKFLSTGSGTFLLGHITPPATTADRIDLTWQELDVLNLTGKLSTTTQGFATESDDEIWTGFDFDITYALLSNADVDGSGTLKFDSGIDIPIEFTGNSQAEQWNIKLPASTIKLSQLGGLLRVAQFELPESVKLTDGYIDFQGDIAVDDEITAQIAVKGHEMSASMLESSALKAGFDFNTVYGNIISASGPVSIETIALAGGIDVANIRADLSLEDMDTFGLKNLYAEVFDGQLNLGSLRFSENRIADASVKFSHINLGRLLAFADIDGLEGTGFLDISLPVGSDNIGVYVKNGTFSSNSPGHLAYTKEGVAGSNIGLQALENFQYKDLSGSVNYQSDGAYQIAIRLEGKNPDLYGGHPVVFNLNIGGSIPELFEAMFMTGSFEESILKQIRTNSSK